MLQMLHAQGIANGQDYMWTNVGDPSEEILEEFEGLLNLNIEDILT